MKKRISIKMRVDCLTCGKIFPAWPWDVNLGYSKYCSRKCCGEAFSKQRILPPKPPNTKCSQCSKTFYRNNKWKKLSKSGHFFCSRVCKDIAQRLEGIKAIHPSHYKNGNNSYRERAFRNYPRICVKCNYNKYIEVLDVHHIDGQRTNNRLENLLIVCPTCHISIHRGIFKVVDRVVIETT